MSNALNAYALWLADYYLLSAGLIALALVTTALLRQPAQRLAVIKSTLLATLLLAALCALPGWSAVHLLTNNATDEPSLVANNPQRPSPPVNIPVPTKPITVDSAAPSPALISSPAQIQPTPATLPLSAPTIVAVAHLATVFAITSWLLLGALASNRLLRTARPAPSHVTNILRDVMAPHFERFPRLVLLTHDRIDVAVALGIRHPAILLPTKWTQRESVEHLRTILAHESTHILNHDLHWLALTRILLVALWANPLFWLVKRRLRLDQEALADAAAADLTSRHEYAEQLVAWARAVRTRPALHLSSAVGLWERPSQLRQRIAMLLNDRLDVLRDCTLRWKTSSFLLCGLAAIGLSLLTLKPGQSAIEPSGSEDQLVRIYCVDILGKPIAGAEIHVFQYHGGKDGRYMHHNGLTSDEHGRANLSKALFDKEHGTFDRWLYARVPGKLVGVARSAKWKFSQVINAEGRVVMRPSRPVEGQVAVPPDFAPQEVTVQVRVMNVITGPGEWDFQSLPREESFPGLDTGLPEIFERRPDAQGHVRFDDVPNQGCLYLVTRGKGLAETQWRNDNGTFEKPFRMAIKKEGRLSGRVLLPDGQPATGMSVAARIKDDAMYLTTFRGKTNANGEFEIDGLPDNTLVLSINDSNQKWVFRPIENILVEVGETADRTLTMEPGVLLSGRVVDEDGKPVQGAGFSAITDTTNGAGLDDDSTDADGRYEFRLPSGGANLYFNSLPDGFAYPEPQIVQTFEIKAGQPAVESPDITLRKTPADAADKAADKKTSVNKSLEAKSAGTDHPDEQGSQMLRDIRAKAEPLLATMAEEHGYGLELGRDLARIPPPFAPIRMEYYRTANPSQFRAIPRGPSAMVFHWANGEVMTSAGMTFGDPANDGFSLTVLIDQLLGIKSQQIEGPTELLRKPTTGDWVVRDGASADSLLEQLQQILQDELSLPVKLKLRIVERPVYVARGAYQLTPLPGRQAEGKLILTDETLTTDNIEIFGKQLVPNSGAGGGCGNFDTFLGWLGRWIGTPIVSEVKSPPKKTLCFQLHERTPSTEETRREDHDPKLVLANITAQTGLEFAQETRPVKLLFVEPAQK